MINTYTLMQCHDFQSSFNWNPTFFLLKTLVLVLRSNKVEAESSPDQ